MKTKLEKLIKKYEKKQLLFIEEWQRDDDNYYNEIGKQISNKRIIVSKVIKDLQKLLNELP